MSKLTLGSLFDGSGGFPLGAVLTGIEPLWASEVEPFPIRVTTKRLPRVKHYGDINKINGATVPPVDIITGGFCCQDLSVAGKRAGLHGERSGLFFQITRIIGEMLAATNNEYPKFAVLENVPGMYSSNGGTDFQEVLNELIHIKQEGLAPGETLSVPLPEKGRWSTAGEIVGDGFSIGWRTLDAQFFGVAQRRRRCYIVVDFTGERAGEILFDESRLSGNPAAGGSAWQGTAGGASAGSGSTIGILNDQGGGFMAVSEDVTGTLRAQEHGHAPIVFEPGAASRVGGHAWSGEPTGTLRADMGDNQLAVAIPINTQVGLRNHKDGDGTGLGIASDGDPAYTLQAGHSHAVAIENHPAGSRVKISEDGIVQTLDARMGMGGGNVPLVASFMGGQGADAGSIAYSEKVTPTLRGQAGGNSVPMVMNERQYALTVGEDVANTLTGTDFKGTQCVFEPKILKIRSGCEGGGKGTLVQENLSATLGCSNDQTLFEPKTYGKCSANSNSMKSANPHSGVYEAETSRTLDLNCNRPDCNQGGMAVVAIEGNGSRPSHRGDGYGGDVSFTLNSVEKHAVCYQDKIGSLCASDYKFPQSQQIDEGKAVVERVVNENYQHGGYREVEKAGTLKASGGDYPGGENVVVENRYVVRRLTPTECQRLQGFPDGWCDGLETPEPTEEDIAFWTEVLETHRNIVGKSTKPKSRNQIIKWLKSPHSDAAEYKMWGNGVALPCVAFVLSGIVYYSRM
jgi:DNA (cytosine-5)-methyltransferase 1